MAEPQGEPGPAGEVTFSTLLIMFGTTGMAQLGAMPDPESGQKRVNLEGVKHTIDILTILRQKTAGNLTEPESRLLEEILFDLRLRFVEATKGR